jgi:sugar phosphate isomerase/epimerase
MQLMTRRSLLGKVALGGLASQLPAAKLSAFKLGITTDEVDDDLAVALEFIKRFGLKYAEIRGLWGKYNTSQPVDRVRHAKNLLDANDIGVCILDTGFFKVQLPPETAEGNKKLDEQWALLDRAMERARIFGTDKIRAFAFQYAKGAKPDESLYPRIAELLKEATRRAKAGGFRLALENVGGNHVSTAAHLAKMLDAVQDEAFGAIWEPNNSVREGGSGFPEGYRLIDPTRIFHVHLRDFRRMPSGKYEWCGVGQGEFDHVGQLRALLKDGYKETLSLETHFTIDGSKAKASEFSMKGLLAAIERV